MGLRVKAETRGGYLGEKKSGRGTKEGQSLNQYPVWIGMVVALVMVCVEPNPAWWMIMVLGMGANGVVVAANGWKMPARGLLEESIRHTPMTGSTRWKWLGDIIPTGLGKASVGDFLLAAGLMGAWATRGEMPYSKTAALACLLWWGSGWARGFGLFEKWPKEARRDCRKNIPIVLALMALGNLLNVRGCSFGALHASEKSLGSAFASEKHSQPKIEPESKWRDLGKLASPSHELLKRLRIDEAKRKAEAQKIARSQFIGWSQSASGTLQPIGFNATTGQLIPISFAEVPGIAPYGSRKGPFCRVTCSFHHKDNQGAGTGDVEVDADYCKTQRIDPVAAEVMGWHPINAQYEQKSPWPGPAQGGLDSYKLYWK